MGSEYYVLIIGYIFGFYMAWNIGANDVANSMASAVGARAITIRQAIFIAGILNIIGAVFIGSHVTQTIRKGIVSTDILADPHLALIGALSALLAAASSSASSRPCRTVAPCVAGASARTGGAGRSCRSGRSGGTSFEKAPGPGGPVHGGRFRSHSDPSGGLPKLGFVA